MKKQWQIHCLIASSSTSATNSSVGSLGKEFPVQSYSYTQPHFLLEDIRVSIGRPSSGIVEIVIETPFSDELYRFTNAQEAIDKVKLWMTFS